MKTRITAILCGVACLAGVSAMPASAQEHIYGSWVSPNHGLNRLALPPVFDSVQQATDGDVTWRLVAGGQLVNGRGTLGGIKDGLIDAGFVLAPYTPSDLPATNLVFNTLVFGRDVVAAAGAMVETVLLHCPQCLEEYKANNGVALAGYAASPYLLMCREEVRTVEDIAGLKIRASGGGVYVMQLAGATPVAMSPAEATTALQRGALDCVLGAPAWLQSYGYQDVARFVLDYPMGMGGPALHFFMNRDRWNALSDPQKQAFIDAAPRSIAEASISAYIVEDNRILDAAIADGIVVHKGGADFAAIAAQREIEQREQNLATAREHGVKDPEAILDAFDQALEKWQGLSVEIDTDVARFTAALQREIYDRIGPDDL